MIFTHSKVQVAETVVTVVLAVGLAVDVLFS
jgi:hypothetical protein